MEVVMAVLVEKRMRVVEDADVAAGRPLRSGPRVMPRRPATKPRPLAVPSSRESSSCEVRPKRESLFELIAVGVLSALTVVALGVLYLQQAGVTP
ncbi:hypothetical protein SK571_13235 [Lentzea sp. BCCO 10_0798]|uniref:Uncharacterized protein n=1 Tax=Lentzea kristufekii TaxID=3095430 RepID=A0ABU4TPY7_9PSEU|nr:hypothetical protein [Lentzea sp. BCCO 10_0798]MDX8050349.1 hypothetical protein [Lentzea sp. BCCO 10_0798]